MKLDTLTVHNDRVTEVVGRFCGTPVFRMDIDDVDFDAARDSRRAVLMAQSQETPSVSTAVTLPGEEVCEDSIVRRTTTAESVGEEYYNKEYKDPANTQRISIAHAMVHSLPAGWHVYDPKTGNEITKYDVPLITWRPDEYKASDREAMYWDCNGKPESKDARDDISQQRDAMVFHDTGYALIHEEVAA